MKRLSSALSAPILPTTAGQAVAIEPATAELSGAELDTLRSGALDAGQPMRLRQWLVADPQRVFHLPLHTDAAPRHLNTLLRAWPDQGPVPPLVLMGPACPDLQDHALARMLTHPGLRELGLQELELDVDRLHAVAQALTPGAGGLSQLQWADDVDCLMNDGVASILKRLPSLRHLTLQMTSTDAANQSRCDAGAVQMARTLASLPLDSLTLCDLGCFMAVLSMVLPKGGVVPWKALEIQEIDLSMNGSAYLLPLTVVLVRCLDSREFRSLQLSGFHIGTAALLAGGMDNLCAPACLDLVKGLAVAMHKRSQPLELAVESDDLSALILLMDGLTGDPDGATASDSEFDEVIAGPVNCVRSLSVGYRPDLGHLEGLELMGDALHSITVWLDAFPRLEALEIALQPTAALPVSSALLLSQVLVHTQEQLARAVSASAITQVTLRGAPLEPTPPFLQPCLADVARRALDRQLRIGALDVGLDFLGRQHRLPPELRVKLVQDTVDGSGSPHPVAVLPALNSQQLAGHVARYNQLAQSVHRNDPAIPLLSHPLTGLSAQVGQRLAASAAQTGGDGLR